MAANTTTTLARTASTLAGPVFTSTATISPQTNLPASYRPNKAELEMRLYHAHIRAHTRRLRQSVLGLSLPSSASVPQRTTRAAAFSLPHTPNSTPTNIGLPILSPAPLPAAAPSPTNLGALPTPPETPEPVNRPRLPTRRSRIPLSQRTSLGFSLNFDDFGEDPILTPNHVFPDNLRRTPGARAPTGQRDTECVFHLPSGLLDTPAQAQMAPHPGSSVDAAAVAGLEATATIPARSGLGSTSHLVGLGISGVDFGEEGRIEQAFLSM